MPENLSQDYISSKAFEIAYALFRLAGSTGHQGFNEHLERSALSMLEGTISRDKGLVERSSAKIEYFIRMAGDTSLIHPANVQIIIRELKGINSAIAELKEERQLPD